MLRFTTKRTLQSLAAPLLPAQASAKSFHTQICNSQVNKPQTGQNAQYQTPSAEKSREHEVADFHRFADIYLGGLWNRFESELRKREGDDFEYDVQISSGCMHIILPDDAKISICKDTQEKALTVESNLHSMCGEDGADPRDSAVFRFSDDDGEFIEGGQALHVYLEDHLAKHLKVQLDLEPQPSSPNDKVYGPDPT